MFGKLFNKSPAPTRVIPEILGLRVGFSFEIDTLMLKLLNGQLVASGINPGQLIQAVGLVQLDDTWLYRFYTDDEAWLQVVAQGGQTDAHVVDVKLFHYFDTLDIGTQERWNQLLNEEIGQPSRELEGHCYTRVWTSAGTYHNPVAMTEKTWDESGQQSQTDQFCMLFERPLADGRTESLFLSAEETEEDHGQLSRCLVISTGITLTPSQIRING